MSWHEVERVLLTEMVSLMNHRGKGKRWVKALMNCEDGELLGACIAIDIISDSIHPLVFAGIVDKISPSFVMRVASGIGSLTGRLKTATSGSNVGIPIRKLFAADNRKEFGKIVNRQQEYVNYVCTSRLRPNPSDADVQYARVLELGDFIEYYIGRGYTSSPTQVQRIKTMYFDKGGGVKLGEVEGWWKTRLPNVWVMPFDDLETLVRGVSDNKRGEVVCDSMGLNIYEGVAPDGRPDLVAVVYPKPFSVGCRQPSTLDAWWIDAGRFYVSHLKVDNWGRTHSVSGTKQSQRERVHSLFKDLTSGFQTYYIGIATPPVEDRNALLDAAYDRFLRGMRHRTPTPSPTLSSLPSPATPKKRMGLFKRLVR